MPSLRSGRLEPRPQTTHDRRPRPRRPIRVVRLVAAAFVLVTLLAGPGAVPVAAQPEPGERPHYDVPRIDGQGLEIDAVLDEPQWDEATAVQMTVEVGPGENVPAPVETTVYLAHDDEAFYVAFDARDPDPTRIRANLTDRDRAFQDDFVGVILDTFNDERRGFEFFVNPYGVQMDLTIDDLAGGSEDSAWDAIWESAGRITETGYVVEMAIPFRSLRFQSTDGPQTWGFQPFRAYPRTVRHRITDVPRDRSISCDLCQASKLVGFEGATPGRNLEINPTLTAGRTDERLDFPTGDLAEGSVDSELGGTLTWGVTPNITVAGTLNPDFSQVEADTAQLDVNNQFALFFPEQRPFFLEGADFFDTPLDAVFTRNVADPSWGVKTTGKVGRSAFGVFLAEDEVTNLLIPGVQGSDATSLDLPTTDTVLRYRRDVGGASALGALYTRREGNGYSNQVGGIDGLWRVNDQHTVRFQLLGSSTEYPGEVVEEFDQPRGSFDDTALYTRYQYSTRDWSAYASYEDRGEDFRADMGFVPRVGYRFYLAGGSRKWIGEDGDWYTFVSLGADVDRTEDQDGNLLEEEAEIFINWNGDHQSYVFIGPGTRERVFNGVSFRENYLNLFGNMQPAGWIEVSLDVRLGDQVDFANTRLGEGVFLRPQAILRLGSRTSLRLDHSYQHLDVDGGRLFEANLSQVRAIYQINLRTFVRLIAQYRDITRDPSLYEDTVDAQTEALATQLLVSYTLNPRTVLFVGYSDGYEGDQEIDLTQERRSVFLKVGYAWVL